MILRPPTPDSVRNFPEEDPSGGDVLIYAWARIPLASQTRQNHNATASSATSELARETSDDYKVLVSIKMRFISLEFGSHSARLQKERRKKQRVEQNRLRLATLATESCGSRFQVLSSVPAKDQGGNEPQSCRFCFTTLWRRA